MNIFFLIYFLFENSFPLSFYFLHLNTSASTIYQYDLPVRSTSTIYQYYLPVLPTSTIYQYDLPVRSTSTLDCDIQLINKQLQLFLVFTWIWFGGFKF